MSYSVSVPCFNMNIRGRARRAANILKVATSGLAPYWRNISSFLLQGHFNLWGCSLLIQQDRLFCCTNLISETKPASSVLLFTSVSPRSVPPMSLSLSSGPIMTTHCFSNQYHCVRDCVYLCKCVIQSSMWENTAGRRLRTTAPTTSSSRIMSVPWKSDSEFPTNTNTQAHTHLEKPSLCFNDDTRLTFSFSSSDNVP